MVQILWGALSAFLFQVQVVRFPGLSDIRQWRENHARDGFDGRWVFVYIVEAERWCSVKEDLYGAYTYREPEVHNTMNK